MRTRKRATQSRAPKWPNRTQLEERKAKVEANLRRIEETTAGKVNEPVARIMGKDVAIVDSKVIVFVGGKIMAVPTDPNLRGSINSAIKEKFGRLFEYYTNS